MRQTLLALPALLLLAAEPVHPPLVADENGDGIISAEEYADMATRIFQRADRNDDGRIDKREDRLRLAAAQDAETIYAIWRHDTDGNDLLTKSEVAEGVVASSELKRNLFRQSARQADAEIPLDDNPEDMRLHAERMRLQLERVSALMDGDSSHILLDEQLRELKDISQSCHELLRVNGSYTLLDYQDAMRAKFRVRDHNGDGALGADETVAGFIFR